MMRLTLILSTLLIVALVAACGRNRELVCAQNTAYREAESARALRVPDDLSVPDETEALQIPEEFPPADGDESDPCLELSPAFE